MSESWRMIGIAVAVIAGCFLTSADPGAAVPYPVDYREWTHVKTMFIGPQSKLFEQRGGFHHYYANSKAVEGYRTCKFPEGAVIVDEGLNKREAGGVILEGSRRSVDVMRKDSRQYSDTGGWGFEHFEGDNQTDGASAQLRQSCFTCHAKNKDHDFVYSEMRK
jgi:cytochrome P460